MSQLTQEKTPEVFITFIIMVYYLGGGGGGQTGEGSLLYLQDLYALFQAFHFSPISQHSNAYRD